MKNEFKKRPSLPVHPRFVHFNSQRAGFACFQQLGEQRHRKILHSMGLTKINRTHEYKDTPYIRGMINKVSHLVRTEENIDEA